MENVTIFNHPITIGPDAIDINGHVNNVEYLNWFIAAAVAHSDTSGCTQKTFSNGCTWVVSEHHLQYLRPCYEGEEITIRTWVANKRQARSLRRYEAVRKTDGKMVAKGYTDWAYVNIKTGRPVTIPEEVIRCFTLIPDDPFIGH